MESFLAASMKPQVLTTVTSASSESVSCQPAPAMRAANSSESVALRAQPSVTTWTDRLAGTLRAYRWQLPAPSALRGAQPCATVGSPGPKLTDATLVVDGGAPMSTPLTIRSVAGALPSFSEIRCESSHVLVSPGSSVPW